MAHGLVLDDDYDDTDVGATKHQLGRLSGQLFKDQKHRPFGVVLSKGLLDDSDVEYLVFS